MSRIEVLSTSSQLKEISQILFSISRLPIWNGNIPGALLENVVAHVRNAKVLKTYDFVDVIDQQNQIGWQMKSTKSDTPVTWKRAKIANKEELISASECAPYDCSNIGKEIINFCNNHIKHSIDLYNLNHIAYSRLVIGKKDVIYFEKLLCTKDNPILFKHEDYFWKWAPARSNSKKELLPSLQGFKIDSKTKKPTSKLVWSWYGHGENQLHSNAEKDWWDDPNNSSITFKLATKENKISLEELFEVLSSCKQIIN